jgi:hypothetical protein
MRYITVNEDSNMCTVVTEYGEDEELPDNVFQISEDLWKAYHEAFDNMREIENQLYFVRSLPKEI